ncbi:ABC transporter, RND-adapter-like protein [hydrothermal vent metagenome]|uniref:ABC transporter, RND-adapter-like protein n=1 Tax=hydrothermal vent metagenome TaxID=652676 RepID=A0A3B0UFM1_9ZZZZ
MKQKKILPYAIVLLVVAILLLVIGKKAGWFGDNVKIKVATQVVEDKSITELITANGKIQPETEVKISPDVSGEIIELYVEEGGQVTRGQLLLVIKPDIYISSLNRMEASLNSSKARLAQAEAQLTKSELSYKRSKQLYEKGTIPASEFETAESNYKVALSEVKASQYSVKSAEASVNEAKEQLTKTKIYAPMPGTVSKLNVEKGERVVGTNMYAGTDMMVIANLDKMEVKVEVNENDIVKVSKNDTALIEVDAYLNRKFKGVVTEIANSANTTGTTADQVTNFDVKVFLLKESYKDLIEKNTSDFYPFRPGMSATVEIQTETRENVISVPIQAVTTRIEKEGFGEGGGDGQASDKKQEIVFVYKDGVVRKSVVQTGIQDNNNIEITEGLTVGDEVVIAPYNAINRILKDSMAVKKVDEKDLYSEKK